MIAAMTTINVRATIVVTTTITARMTIVMTTTTMDVELTTTSSMTITDVNTTIVETITIVVTTTTDVRMMGVAITTIVNKTTIPIGITAETPSGVTAIIPRGVIVTTKILVIMTTRAEGIIRRIIVISITRDDANDNFRQEDGNSNNKGRKESPRVTMTAPQGNIIKGTIVVIKIPPRGAIVIPTGVSTTTTSTRRNVRMRVARLHVRPYAVPTTLGCSRVATCAFPTTLG